VKGILDKDMGFADLFTKFESGKESAVFVGYLRSSGVYKPKVKGGKAKALTVAQLGAIHEFGSSDGKHPPMRSFMRATESKNRAKIVALCSKLLNLVIDGHKGEKAALGTLGEYVKNLMKTTIQKGVPPALKASTIARKGSSKPLIDTGQLINSIDWQVVGAKK